MVKWTQDMRMFLYKGLVREFGPSDKWKQNRPDDLAKFREFKKDMAKALSYVSAGEQPITEDAVDLQIRWALTTQEQVEETHARTYVMCKAAALEVGLISKALLPKLLLADNST